MIEDNKIFVGGKPFMNYVTGIIMQFTTKSASEVIVKSRGKYISRAVDIVEVTVKNYLLNEIKVKDVVIGSSTFTNTDGVDVRISTMDIFLVKN